MGVRSTLFGSVRAVIFRELTTVARLRPSGGYFVAGSTPSVLHVLARGALSDYRLVSSHPSRQSCLPHAPARCKSQGGEGRSNALHCVWKSSRSPITSTWDSGNVPKPCENPHRRLYPSNTPTDLRILLHCLIRPGSAKHNVRPSATNTGDRGRARAPK